MIEVLQTDVGGTSITDALGNQESFQYNKKSQLIEKIDKEGYLTTYAYNTTGHGIGRVFDHMAANAAWSSATRSAKKMAIRETGISNAMVNEVLHATKNAFTELAKNGTNNQVLRSILTRFNTGEIFCACF